MMRGTWWPCAVAAVLQFAACSEGDGGNGPSAAAPGGASGASGASGATGNSGGRGGSGGKLNTGGLSTSAGSGGRAAGGGSSNTSGAGGSEPGGSASGGAAAGEANGGAAGDPGGQSGGTTSTGGAPNPGAAGSEPSAGAAGDASFDGSVERTWNFDADTEGWSGAFSDYPEGEDEFYELQFAQAALPPELGDGGGLVLGGDNHSDDLFMYLSHRLEGLKPSASYSLDVEVVIGTNAPSDCGGIGGSPGPSVHFKIGASAREPESRVDEQGILRLNLDKGNQSMDGAEMKRVGDVGNTLVCPDPMFQRKTLSLSDFLTTTAADGSLWLVIGTDSGFEGETLLYYDRISVTLTAR